MNKFARLLFIFSIIISIELICMQSDDDRKSTTSNPKHALTIPKKISISPPITPQNSLVEAQRFIAPPKELSLTIQPSVEQQEQLDQLEQISKQKANTLSGMVGSCVFLTILNWSSQISSFFDRWFMSHEKDALEYSQEHTRFTGLEPAAASAAANIGSKALTAVVVIGGTLGIGYYAHRKLHQGCREERKVLAKNCEQRVELTDTAYSLILAAFRQDLKSIHDDVKATKATNAKLVAAHKKLTTKTKSMNQLIDKLLHRQEEVTLRQQRIVAANQWDLDAVQDHMDQERKQQQKILESFPDDISQISLAPSEPFSPHLRTRPAPRRNRCTTSPRKKSGCFPCASKNS